MPIEIRPTTLYDLNRSLFVGPETEKLEDWIHIPPLAIVLPLLPRVNLNQLCSGTEHFW